MVRDTPGTVSKSDSTHQKQPPAKVAIASPLGAGADAVPSAARAPPPKAPMVAKKNAAIRPLHMDRKFICLTS